MSRAGSRAAGGADFRWISWVAVAAFTALWASRWPAFPLGPDPAYHLHVARQVVEAGGPMTHESWEAAPEGRPHLYPPALHVALGGLLAAGVDPLIAIRLLSVALPSLWLLTIFLVSRRLFGDAAGGCAVLAGLVPFSAHVAGAVTMAATLAAIELLWLVVAIEERRPLAAGGLAVLLVYTHLGMPLIAATTVAGCAVLRPEIRATVRRAAWGLPLAMPWWWHLWRHQRWVSLVGREENAHVVLQVGVLLAAAAGLWACCRRQGRWVWLPALALGFLWLAPFHQYRWLSGEGLLPMVLLAGAGLAWLVRRAPWPRLIAVAIWLALVAAPSLAHIPQGQTPEGSAPASWRWIWPDAAPWHLAGLAAENPMEISLAAPKLLRWAPVVAAQTAPGEILWSNAPYAGGLVCALAGRAMSSIMLPDVAPLQPDRVGAAHAILWWKIEMDAGYELERVIRPGWIRLAEDDLAVLFRQPGSRPLAPRPRACLSLALAAALLAGAAGLCAWDLSRPGQASPKPV